MANYLMQRCANGWTIREHANPDHAELKKPRTWIAHTAAEAGEIIGREEGEHPILGQIETRSLEDSQEQED